MSQLVEAAERTPTAVQNCEVWLKLRGCGVALTPALVPDPNEAYEHWDRAGTLTPAITPRVSISAAAWKGLRMSLPEDDGPARRIERGRPGSDRARALARARQFYFTSTTCIDFT